jgi:hypothetical protein
MDDMPSQNIHDMFHFFLTIFYCYERLPHLEYIHTYIYTYVYIPEALKERGGWDEARLSSLLLANAIPNAQAVIFVEPTCKG